MSHPRHLVFGTPDYMRAAALAQKLARRLYGKACSGEFADAHELLLDLAPWLSALAHDQSKMKRSYGWRA